MTALPQEHEAPLPALFTHCENVYDAMFKASHRVYTEPGTTNTVEMVVYEGRLTKLVESLHLPVPYYSATRTELMRMGCIRQLRRGGGSQPSQWELIRRPTEELWKTAEGYKQPGNDKAAIAEQRTRDLAHRVSALEAKVEALVTAVQPLLEG